MDYSIDNSLNKILNQLDKRQEKVIKNRYGLNGKKYTLQEIGDDLGVTRERVRQIENHTSKKVKPLIKKEFSQLIKKAEDILKKTYGIRRNDYFINEIKTTTSLNGETKNLDNKIKFIFLITGKPSFQPETDDFYTFWYKDKTSKNKMEHYIKKVAKFFKDKGKRDILENKVYLNNFKEPYFDNCISISKLFGTNSFGDFGLVEWPEVNPKVIRDKAYLVLKKQGKKPLHFKKIAGLINEFGIDDKNIHVQTVHNELIKDPRFVLVGRGMYGLKEYGFEGGTVKELIEKLLKEHGPLHPEDVVKLVNQKKVLKKNTIVLNLQSRQNFKRLDDGRYHVKEA